MAKDPENLENAKDVVDKYAAPAPIEDVLERGQVTEKQLLEAVDGLKSEGVVVDKNVGEIGDLPKATTPDHAGTDGRPFASSAVVEKYAAPAPNAEADKPREIDRSEPDRD